MLRSNMTDFRGHLSWRGRSQGVEESGSQGGGYSIFKEPWAVSPNTLQRERPVPASFVVGATTARPSTSDRSINAVKWGGGGRKERGGGKLLWVRGNSDLKKVENSLHCAGRDPIQVTNGLTMRTPPRTAPC